MFRYHAQIKTIFFYFRTHVRTGEHDLRTVDNDMQEFRIIRRVLADFNSVSFENDISIVLLDRLIDFDSKLMLSFYN